MEQLAVLSDWREPLILAGQVLLILLLAWAVQRLVGRGITRLGERYAALLLEKRDGQHQLLWVTGWMSDAGIVRESRQVIAPLNEIGRAHV